MTKIAENENLIFNFYSHIDQNNFKIFQNMDDNLLHVILASIRFGYEVTRKIRFGVRETQGWFKLFFCNKEK